MFRALHFRALASIGFSSVSIALWASSKPSGSELKLFEASNHERHRHGLKTLKWDESLAAAARKHAARNAQAPFRVTPVSGRAEPSKPSPPSWSAIYLA